MASTNKTARGLNAWVESDIPAMEDFNADNEQIENLLDGVKEDVAKSGVNNRAFSIVPEAWGDSTEYVSYPFETVIPVGDISETDDALVLFAANSVAAARNAGMADGIAMTADGGIRIFAERIPSQALSGTYALIHREA